MAELGSDHPDASLAAIERTGIPAKVYFTA